MKEHLLKAIYSKYRPYFYSFFVDEFMADIPKETREPAMAFLSQGKERLEKWALFQARMLQTRLVRDPNMILTYQGMLLMLKLLLVHTELPDRRLQITQEEGKSEQKDFIAQASKAVSDYKKNRGVDSGA